MAGSNLFVGTLDLLILRAVRSQPLHGYAIGAWIRDRTEGVLDVAEGALYPALHRLEGKGLLEASWGQSETGRQAKFYRPTRRGRKELRTETERWQEHSRAVAAALEA